MPFFLSFFLFINAGVWVFYAALVKDIYIGVRQVPLSFSEGKKNLNIFLKSKNLTDHFCQVPNVLGLFLSSAQLILYAIYFEYKKAVSTKDEEGVEKKEPTFVDTNEDDLEIQRRCSPTKNKQANLCNDLSIPKPQHIYIPTENGVKKIIKAVSTGSYELQAIVLSTDEVDNVMKKIWIAKSTCYEIQGNV